MIEDIKLDLEREFGNSSFRINEETDTTLYCDCRNWGEWEISEDDCFSEEEDDCQDYDFEQLTEDSTRDLIIIMSDLKKKYIKLSISYSISEKNYIDFEVEVKK